MSERDNQADVSAVAASDAFGALGNDIRMVMLGTLQEARDDETVSFSALFEQNPAETTAQFAYHLRQLVDLYVRKEDDEYTLTYAGREITQAMSSGTYTESVDFDRQNVDDPCPLCGTHSLGASAADNYVTIDCSACETPILTLPFPPGGHRGHSPDSLLSAFDRHHRHRLSTMSDGVCPECGATTTALIEYARDVEERPRVSLDCEACGCQIRCPVTLTVLEHPAVVSFYHEHNVDVRDRPLWNVGDEWREVVVSDDPWCVRVSTRLRDDVLDLLVGQTLEVVDVQRREAA